jgi:hypothetical protein
MGPATVALWKMKAGAGLLQKMEPATVGLWKMEAVTEELLRVESVMNEPQKMKTVSAGPWRIGVGLEIWEGWNELAV